jgi:hypothetical protein
MAPIKASTPNQDRMPIPKSIQAFIFATSRNDRHGPSVGDELHDLQETQAGDCGPIAHAEIGTGMGPARQCGVWPSTIAYRKRKLPSRG